MKNIVARQITLKSQTGWILIESLVGMTVLTVAILALLLAFTQSTKSDVASTNRTKATYLAQQALDILKAQDGQSAISTAGIATNSGIFTITISIPSVSAITSGTNNLSTYLIPYQVVVSWNDSSSSATNNVTMIGYCYVNP